MGRGGGIGNGGSGRAGGCGCRLLRNLVSSSSSGGGGSGCLSSGLGCLGGTAAGRALGGGSSSDGGHSSGIALLRCDSCCCLRGCSARGGAVIRCGRRCCGVVSGASARPAASSLLERCYAAPLDQLRLKQVADALEALLEGVVDGDAGRLQAPARHADGAVADPALGKGKGKRGGLANGCYRYSNSYRPV